MDSVLNQTYANIEYLIIDGASKDGTKDIIKSKAQKFQQVKWISEPDQGIYDALNKGIKMATGDVIGFVHSDDFLANNDVIEQVAKIFSTHHVVGVYGDLHYVAFENKDKVIRNWKSRKFKPSLLQNGWMPAHPTLFLKSSVYKNKGTFDLTYKIAADYDFILRVFTEKTYSFYYLQETMTKMRVGGASNKSLKNMIKKSREDFKAAKTNGLQLPFKVILNKNLSKISQWFNK